jgi:hypothetical protein
MPVGVGLGDVPQLLAGHVGFVEGDVHGHLLFEGGLLKGSMGYARTAQ